MLRLLLAAFAMTMVVAPAPTFDDAHFFLVGDAGSGGTRFQVYDAVTGAEVAKASVDEDDCGANAMGTIVENDQADAATWWTNQMTCLDTHLTGKLTGKATLIGTVSAALKDIHIFIRATAGMRQSGGKVGVFAAVAAAAQTAHYNKVDVQIIAGAVEGLYGYQSNNVATNQIYIEQGGASFQVAFECPSQACTTDALAHTSGFRRRLLSQKKKENQQLQLSKAGAEGYIVDDTKCYFSESFMGYGQDELLAILLLSGDANAKHCLTTGLVLTQAADGTFSGTWNNAALPDRKKLSFLRELEDYIKITGGNLGAAVNLPHTITGDGDVTKCKKAISTVTLGSGKEVRGFKGDDPTVGTNNAQVTFAPRWARIKQALAVCGSKTELFSNTAAWRGQKKGYARPDGVNSDGYLDAASRANGYLNPATFFTDQIFTTPVNGPANHNGFKPMVAAALLFFHEQMVAEYGSALTLKAKEDGKDWKAAFAASVVAKKHFEYASNAAATKTGNPATAAGKFIFVSDNKGPNGHVAEPEMWQLKHTTR